MFIDMRIYIAYYICIYFFVLLAEKPWRNNIFKVANTHSAQTLVYDTILQKKELELLEEMPDYESALYKTKARWTWNILWH